MDLGTMVCIVGSTGIIIGGTIKGVFFMKNRKLVLTEELGSIKDRLYVLSKNNEEARRILEKSNSKKIKNEKELRKEIEKLNKSVQDITEHRQKESLLELENLREQLHIIALNNNMAKKELQRSFVSRITTEKTASREITRLKKIIHIINESRRKELMDKIVSLREELQILNTDRAIQILSDSFNRKDMNEREMNKEITKLKNSISEINIDEKRKYMQQLKEIRNRMYTLSLECTMAKEELENSYQRKLIDIEDIKEEIDNLNLIYIDCVEINRKDKINELNELRDEVYSNSKDSAYARMKLEESFNRLFSNEIIEKEIDRLEETLEKVYRDNNLKKYKKQDELYL